MIKFILGLDLGVASVGWAFIKDEDGQKSIVDIGGRILPLNGAEIIEFQKGNAQTKNADRRILRGVRKGNKRYKVRRNKLIYILQKLNILPNQFEINGDFINPNKIQDIGIMPILKGNKQATAFDFINLRVKALTQKIEPHEFGKILYLFNQLRGYSGGGQEPEKEEFAYFFI